MKYSHLIISLIFSVGLFGQDYNEIANLKSGEYPDQTQLIIGFWVVESVVVGEENLTPTAKWFEFTADGTQTSGNGWVQNALGGWRYEPASTKFYSTDRFGSEDEYGPFTLTVNDQQMTWSRLEDGMKVIVTLNRAEEKPLAPWDLIVGQWTLHSSEDWQEGSNTRNTSDVESFSYYFRWDRRYVKRDASGKRVETGIWHIESHDPWLWLIPDDGSPKRGQTLLFEKDGMSLHTKSKELNEKLYFSRE